MSNEKNIEVKRSDIKAFKVEENEKTALAVVLEKTVKENGTLGRIRDDKRNTAWRRLLGFSRSKVECSDETVHAFLSAHFELCLSQAILNGLTEKIDKGADEWGVEDMENLTLFLGTRTSALKAFGEKEEEESDI